MPQRSYRVIVAGAIVLGGHLALRATSPAFAEPANAADDDDATVWKSRLVASLREVESPRGRAMAVSWVARIHPPVLAGASGDELRKLVEEAAARAEGEAAKMPEGVLAQWDDLRRGAARPASRLEFDRNLDEFRRRRDAGKAGYAAVYNVISGLLNADRAAPLPEAEVEAVLEEFEALARQRNDRETWGAVALAYERLARHAREQKRPAQVSAYLDRMAQILIEHPVYQDPAGGNTAAPIATAVVALLLDSGRRADLEKLAGAARPADARDLWAALAGRLARSGDFDGAREVVMARLAAPDDARAAAAMTAALEGRAARPEGDDLYGLSQSVLTESVIAVADGHARRGDAEAALRVVDVDRGEPWEQAEACRSLAEEAAQAGHPEAAKRLILEGWERYKDVPDKNDSTLARFSTTAVEVGVDGDVVKEMTAATPGHFGVTALVALARRDREAGKRDDIRNLLKAAEARAEDTPTGDGGPARGLMAIAEEYQAWGDRHGASNLALRAVLGAEAMADPFFFGPGAYASVVATCRKMGRADLVERGYHALSRPEDRVIYAAVALVDRAAAE